MLAALSAGLPLRELQVMRVIVTATCYRIPYSCRSFPTIARNEYVLALDSVAAHVTVATV